MITAAVIGILFVLAAVLSVILLCTKGNNATAYIYSDGELKYTLPLDSINETVTMRIDSENGGYNIVEAEKGKIHVTEASCPDKICMHTGYISDGTVPISCLPNKLIIRVEKKKTDNEPDIMAN
ncbi:NusG domain II-containing protein [Ruminococcus sp. HUN007]|uniref:NusG domain II-containing protein n=1 Tax=Ruminococcus sp. HUN007 TaxID=1514668 RepID=UPI0009DFD310